MKKIYPYVYLVVASILIGAIGTFVKLIGTDIHFTTMVFYRMLLALIFSLMFVPFLDKETFKKPSKRKLKLYFITGLLASITFTLFMAANLYAPVQNVILITNFAPFFILIWAYLFLNEKITKTKIITLLIAIIGISILNPFRFGENTLGNFLALTQSLFYSFLIISMRKMDISSSIGSIIWFFFFSTIIMLPFPFIFGWGNLTTINLLYILFLGAISTGLAYIFHNLALEKVGAEISSIIMMIVMPLAAISIAYFTIGESLNTRVLIGGGLLIVAGIYLQAHNKKLKSALKETYRTIERHIGFS